MRLFTILIFSILTFTFTLPELNSKGKEPLVAYLKDGKWHFLDTDGDLMMEPMPLVNFFGYSERLFAAKAYKSKDELFSIFFDSTATVQIAIDADIADPFKNGMALVANRTSDSLLPYRAGFINKKGDLVVPMEYVDFTSFGEDGLAYLMDSLAKDGWRGYIDTSGKRIIELPDNIVGYQFSEGLAMVGDSVPNLGFINKKGDIVLPPIYDSPSKFSEGLAATSDNSLMGYISKETGKFVIEPKYEAASDFSEGRAFVGKMTPGGQPKWALINPKGDMLKNFMYDYANPFSEGLASVYVDNKFIFIGKDGEPAIQKIFTYAGSFENGLAWAAIAEDKTQGYIDKNGEWVVKLPLAEKYIDLRSNKQVGLIGTLD
ncbi:MAG: WG repeat-containing protein [Candidatus Kapaibacteriales bacterium]